MMPITRCHIYPISRDFDLARDEALQRASRLRLDGDDLAAEIELRLCEQLTEIEFSVELAATTL